MAVEGGANYRAGLVRRSKTKKDIAALRRKQAKDPMAWSKEKNPAKGLDKVIKSAKKSGLSFDSYNSLIKNAYGQGSGTFESGEFKPGLEGMLDSKPERIDLNLRGSRALEGLTNQPSDGVGASNPTSRPGNLDTMYKKGDTYFPALEKESLTDNLSMIASFIKDNPRLAAEYGALASLQPFGRILGTGGDMGRDFEEGKGRDLIRPGSAIAYGAENEMGKPASASDYADAGSWLVPGVGFSKPAVLAGKAAKAIDKSVPRPVTAGILAGGVAGAELAQPEEASAAWNLAKPASAAGIQMQKIIGKNISDFTPDDISMLLKNYTQLVLGRSDRPGAFDTNYNDKRIQREAFNEMLDETGQTGNKRGYASWFKNLPEEAQATIKSEGRELDNDALSRLGIEALMEYTTVVNGKRVWKQGGREAMLTKHDLGHKTFGAERGTKKHDLFFQPSKENRAAAAIFARK
jgi:hypothetical protein